MPVKSKKLKVRNRFFNYLVVADELGHSLIQKRTAKGIWHNLYEFPLIETEKEEDFDVMLPQIQKHFEEHNTITAVSEYNEKSIIHKLSHQHLHIKFWKVSIKGRVVNGVTPAELPTFPFPIVIHNFIEKDF